MATTFHPPIYYKVRSVVRFVFWFAVAVAFVFGFGALVNRNDDDARNCPVELWRDFTWTSINNQTFDLDACEHPTGIVLLPDGTWWWHEWAN